MSALIKLGNFFVGANQGSALLTTSPEETPLTFASGEAAVIKELIGTALSMESLSVLPEKIDIHLFRIKFHEDDTLTLCTSDERAGEVRFSWLQGDELITRVEDGYNMIMNDRQVAGPSGPIRHVPESGEPFV
jgi:hypothetical protein